MTHTKPLYAILASALQALHTCNDRAESSRTSFAHTGVENIDGNKQHWLNMIDMHADKIESLCKQYLPHGSGFDSGCTMDMEASKPNRLIFSADFHHMNDNGYYDGWSTHQVILTPDLAFGFTMRITGRDRRQIKDYIAGTFHSVLSQQLEH